jgi:hypothetical protein
LKKEEVAELIDSSLGPEGHPLGMTGRAIWPDCGVEGGCVGGGRFISSIVFCGKKVAFASLMNRIIVGMGFPL